MCIGSVQDGTVQGYCADRPLCARVLCMRVTAQKGRYRKMKHYKITANYTSKPAQWPYFIKTLDDLSVKEVKRRFVARFSWLKVFTCEEIPEAVAIEENNFDWWIIL